MQVNDDIFHLGIVDRALCLAAPSVLGRCETVVDSNKVDCTKIEVETARIPDLASEDQMKLAHGAPRYLIRALASALVADRVHGGAGRSAGGVGQAVNQAANGFFALLAGEAELVEAS